MTDSEKWAYWTLGVIALTAIAYATAALLGAGPASQAAFALMALTAIPANSRRKFKGRQFDEREQKIADKAHLAGFRAFWCLFAGVVMALGFSRGWDATLSFPMWRLSESLIWSMILVVGVESIATLILYRRGSHA
jgi:hypothetical protein